MFSLDDGSSNDGSRSGFSNFAPRTFDIARLFAAPSNVNVFIFILVKYKSSKQNKTMFAFSSAVIPANR